MSDKFLEAITDEFEVQARRALSSPTPPHPLWIAAKILARELGDPIVLNAFEDGKVLEIPGVADSLLISGNFYKLAQMLGLSSTDLHHPGLADAFRLAARAAAERRGFRPRGWMRAKGQAFTGWLNATTTSGEDVVLGSLRSSFLADDWADAATK